MIGAGDLQPMRFRHIKRGTIYRVLSEATMQCEGRHIFELWLADLNRAIAASKTGGHHG